MLTDKERDALIMDLQNHTPLQRINIAEARVVFDRLATLGYTLQPPTKPADAGLAAALAAGSAVS